MRRFTLYDTTLRDGLGMEGLSLSLEDKLLIVQKLDELGVHYIEGGYPGSNPKDAEFFQRAKSSNSSTRSWSPSDPPAAPAGDVRTDPAIRAVLEAETPAVTLVGKSSAARCARCSRPPRKRTSR
jgi:2-isopropylmalate synthase